MYNDILTIGPFTIHGYGLMISIGVLCAVFVAAYRAEKKGLDKELVQSLSIVALISGFIGAKLLFIIVELEAVMRTPALIVSGAGFVLYGGIIGGILAAVIYCRAKKVSFLEYFDLLAPSISLAQGFGRVGCFLAGCCYGCETDSFIGITFKNSAIAPNLVKLVPTQLISSVSNFAIGAILLIYARNKRKPGKVALLYLVLYSVFRFNIEFVRNDYRGSIGFMSTSQFISVIVFALAVTLFILDSVKTKKKAKANEADKE